MITRQDLIDVGARELLERGDKAAADPHDTMASIADALGLRATKPPPSCLFVRRTEWVPVHIAALFDVVIVCGRIESAIRPGEIVRANRDAGWYSAVRLRGTEVVIWDWMIPPGLWRDGLGELAIFSRAVGALGVCLNVEPASGSDKYGARDWRGKRDELAAYATAARDECDARGLELWVTSWALPPDQPTRPERHFALEELVRPSHRQIPQPYEVHGRSGLDYIAEVLGRWTEAGARDVILGRGAHELDKSDQDAWRTPAQIKAHRRSTPVGYGEAWWTPAGQLAGRRRELDAMLYPPPGTHPPRSAGAGST